MNDNLYLQDYVYISNMPKGTGSSQRQNSVRKDSNNSIHLIVFSFSLRMRNFDIKRISTVYGI